MRQSNPLSPDRMTPDQRLSEVAAIITKGIIRLREPNSHHPLLLDSNSDLSVAITAHRSVHGDTEAVIEQEKK